MEKEEKEVIKFDVEVYVYDTKEPVHESKPDQFKVTLMSLPNMKVGISGAKATMAIKASDDYLKQMFGPGLYVVKVYKKTASKPTPQTNTAQTPLNEKGNKDPGAL